MTRSSFYLFASTCMRDLHRAYWILLKVLVPALIVVRLLEVAGAVAWLGESLRPVMGAVGLPGEAGLIWAAAMLTNIYTALVVFYEIASGSGYSTAQVSTLACLILLSHALPVEGAVAKLIGVPWRVTLILRIGGAVFLAWCVHLIYVETGWGSEASAMPWQPPPREDGWWAWGTHQAYLLMVIYVVLAALIVFMRVLRSMGLERWLHSLLRPLTWLFQVDKDDAKVTLIGLLLGLSFGAGLLIDEAQKGHVSRRDMCLVVCFLGLCHSVIEDTLLILLMGPELWVVLWLRLLFGVAVTVLLARYLYVKS
ncbi:MAG: hypothetical protein R3183_02360 [Oleiphilaceae bacterium]|nr:hypothetical protein [Oleiphilaceae bacterium]